MKKTESTGPIATLRAEHEALRTRIERHATVNKAVVGISIGTMLIVGAHGAATKNILEIGGAAAAPWAGGWVMGRRVTGQERLREQKEDLGRRLITLTNPLLNPEAVPAESWMSEALNPEERRLLCIDIYRSGDANIAMAAANIAPTVQDLQAWATVQQFLNNLSERQ